MVEHADGGPEVAADAAAAPVRRRRVLLTGLAVLATAVLVGYCLLLVVPSVLGFQRYVLVGGSMEPTIHRGSLVFDRVAPVGDLHVGDVITYVPPGMTHPLSHRIVHVTDDESGGRRLPHPWGCERVARPLALHAQRCDAGPGVLQCSLCRLSPLAARQSALRLVLIGDPRAADRRRHRAPALASRWRAGSRRAGGCTRRRARARARGRADARAEVAADVPQDEDVELVRS